MSTRQGRSGDPRKNVALMDQVDAAERQTSERVARLYRASDAMRRSSPPKIWNAVLGFIDRLAANKVKICIHITVDAPMPVHCLSMVDPNALMCDACMRTTLTNPRILAVLDKDQTCDICGKVNEWLARFFQPAGMLTYYGFACPDCTDGMVLPTSPTNKETRG